MPIYEYSCGACGRRSSALLPSYDSDDPPCPHCGGTDLQRLVSTFATVRSGGEDLSDFGGADGDLEPGGYGGEMGEGEGWGGGDDFGEDDF